jgi:hypothetical protein
MVHLFAALPAVDGERVEVKRIHNCRRYALFKITMFFPSVLGDCALNTYFYCHYVYSYILPGILAYHKNCIGLSNILHGNLQTCM